MCAAKQPADVAWADDAAWARAAGDRERPDKCAAKQPADGAWAADAVWARAAEPSMARASWAADAAWARAAEASMARASVQMSSWSSESKESASC